MNVDDGSMYRRRGMKEEDDDVSRGLLYTRDRKSVFLHLGISEGAIVISCHPCRTNVLARGNRHTSRYTDGGNRQSSFVVHEHPGPFRNHISG